MTTNPKNTPNQDIENSYLLTELETVTSRNPSPNSSALYTSSNMRPRKRALKS